MSKKLQVNDILAASDIDYIDTLENENAKLREDVERLNKEYKSAHQALADMEGLPELVSSLRRDIERRKQRHQRLLNNKSEWRQRAEKSEAELALLKAEGTPNQRAVQRFAIEQKIKALEEFKKECGMFVPVHHLKDKIEQLRKELEK